MWIQVPYRHWILLMIILLEKEYANLSASHLNLILADVSRYSTSRYSTSRYSTSRMKFELDLAYGDKPNIFYDIAALGGKDRLTVEVLNENECWWERA